MGKWTVSPETIRHEGEWNGEAFWVALKKQLTAGEDIRMKSAGFTKYRTKGAGQQNIEKRVKPDQRESTIDIDFERLAVARVTAYLVDWSLEEDGKRLKVEYETIENLHPDFVEVLNNMINSHEEAVNAEKKVSSGSKKPKTKSA